MELIILLTDLCSSWTKWAEICIQIAYLQRDNNYLNENDKKFFNYALNQRERFQCAYWIAYEWAHSDERLKGTS